MKKIVVVASGYFNPLHIGHVRYLKEAKKLGTELIVIVNNDEQVRLKKSEPFMNEKERMEIIDELKPVDKVVLSIDGDESIARTLALINPDIFVKGGDRNIDNIPKEERETCKMFGIKVVSNVGGEKVQSSSQLLKEYNNQP